MSHTLKYGPLRAKKLSVWIRESVWFDTDNSINNNINPDFK